MESDAQLFSSFISVDLIAKLVLFILMLSAEKYPILLYSSFYIAISYVNFLRHGALRISHGALFVRFARSLLVGILFNLALLCLFRAPMRSMFAAVFELSAFLTVHVAMVIGVPANSSGEMLSRLFPTSTRGLKSLNEERSRRAFHEFVLCWMSYLCTFVATHFYLLDTNKQPFPLRNH